MGVIASEEGRRATLGARVLVGRGGACDLRLEDASVSAEHAVLYWHHDRWHVRDLGSTNGTFVGDVALRPGEPVPLSRGAELRFGAPGGAARWRLVDDAAPFARARSVDSGDRREAVQGLLELPDGDAPLVTVFERGGTWISERDEVQSPVRDQQVIQVGTTAWLLELPPPRAAGSVATTRRGDASLIELEASILRFRVSKDEEYVELTLIHGTNQLAIPARSHHYVLLLLARRRAEDARNGLPPGEQGWMYADELGRELDATRTKLNLDICRARRQLAELGVSGAGNLIERRSTTRQLRLGCARTEILSF